MGFFSTQERKMVTTGEGGFILTDNDEAADKVREIRDFGKPVRKTPELVDHLGQYGYLFGLNFRLAALSAALGITQVAKLPRKIAQRTANVVALRREVSALEGWQELRIGDTAVPNYYSMVLFTEHPGIRANDVARALYEQGVVSDTYRFGIQPLYELPLFEKYASACPNATWLLQHIITLPTHEGLSKADIQNIVVHLKKLAVSKPAEKE